MPGSYYHYLNLDGAGVVRILAAVVSRRRFVSRRREVWLAAWPVHRGGLQTVLVIVLLVLFFFVADISGGEKEFLLFQESLCIGHMTFAPLPIDSGRPSRDEERVLVHKVHLQVAEAPDFLTPLCVQPVRFANFQDLRVSHTRQSHEWGCAWTEVRGGWDRSTGGNVVRVMKDSKVNVGKNWKI